MAALALKCRYFYKPRFWATHDHLHVLCTVVFRRQHRAELFAFSLSLFSSRPNFHNFPRSYYLYFASIWPELDDFISSSLLLYRAFIDSKSGSFCSADSQSPSNAPFNVISNPQNIASEQPKRSRYIKVVLSPFVLLTLSYSDHRLGSLLEWGCESFSDFLQADDGVEALFLMSIRYTRFPGAHWWSSRHQLRSRSGAAMWRSRVPIFLSKDIESQSTSDSIDSLWFKTQNHTYLHSNPRGRSCLKWSLEFCCTSRIRESAPSICCLIFSDVQR